MSVQVSRNQRLKIGTAFNALGCHWLGLQIGFSRETRPNTLCCCIDDRRVNLLIADRGCRLVKDVVKIVSAFHDVSPNSAQSLFSVLYERGAAPPQRPFARFP